MSDRLLAGVIVIAVVAIVGGLLYRSYVAKVPGVTTLPEASSVSPEATRNSTLRAVMTRCDRIANGRSRISGYVENIGTTALAAVTLQVIWKDEYYDVIDTSLVYAVARENPLAVGETRHFEDTTNLRNVAACNVRALDWWAAS